MFVPFIALPLVGHLIIAVADNVPRLDVTQSCRGAAADAAPTETKKRMQICLDTEQSTRDALAKEWTKFAPTDRTYCVNTLKGFAPTYTELMTCLEMNRDVKKLR
jgi:hypothetical protein